MDNEIGGEVYGISMTGIKLQGPFVFMISA